MAGISVTKAQWDALLQEDYVMEGIVEAVNKATPFKEKIRRKGMTHGRRTIYPVQTGMSTGQGARAELEAMPAYGAQEFVDAIITAKYNYGTFLASGPSLEFSSRKAWVEFGDQQMKGTKEGLAIDIGRQCWSDGSGKLALVNNGAGYAIGASVIAVDSAYGVGWGSNTKHTFLIRKNMLVQFGATGDNAGAGYTVTAVTPTSITVSPALVVAIVDNVAIYKFKSKDKEIQGYLKFVGTAAFMTGVLALADATYNGIDRATYDGWEGNVLNAGGVALSLALVRSLKDTVFERAEDEDSNLCINSTYATAAYEALLTPNQRYVPALKLEGGFTALEHDGLRLTKDSKAPVKSFNVLNTRFIAWRQTQDPHWDNDGSGPLRAVAGQDAREAILKWYSDLDVTEPRRNGILYGIL